MMIGNLQVLHLLCFEVSILVICGIVFVHQLLVGERFVEMGGRDVGSEMRNLSEIWV